MKTLSRSLVTALGTTALTMALPAQAADLHVAAEAGGALPVSAPQSDRFGVGGGGSVRAGLEVLPFLDVQVEAEAYAFGGKGGAASASNVGAGAGPRFRLPRGPDRFSPWVDLTGGYIRTGSLDRLGVSAGTGIHFPTRTFAFGPFLRYTQVVQTDEPRFDAGDARILALGLSVEIAVAKAQPAVPTKEKRVEAAPIPAIVVRHDRDGDGVEDDRDKCPDVPGPAEEGGCPPAPKVVDGDGDGVPDARDVCPTVPGVPENQGCPVYKQVVANYDKGLELKQKVFFAFDKAVILRESFGLLDEVAQVLKDAPDVKIRIEGHTDKSGYEKHNAHLSETRALAVRDYLIDHGVDGSRLDAKGYGSKNPIDTNGTPDGRERNRRVEFVILQAKRPSP